MSNALLSSIDRVRHFIIQLKWEKIKALHTVHYTVCLCGPQAPNSGTALTNTLILLCNIFKNAMLFTLYMFCLHS